MFFNITSKEDLVLKEVYDKSVKEFEEFFNIKEDYEKPRIYVVNDRDTIDKLLLRKTGKIVCWNERKDIFVFDRTQVEEINDEDYYKIIKHELCHCYFLMYSNYSKKPYWLYDGLAIYLSGQNRSKIKEFKDFLNYYDLTDLGVYKESGIAVEFLIKYYGKQKLLSLIKSLKYISSQEQFCKSFKEVYGFDLKYENFKA